jgi:beta-lactamase superfamily II metal-dependent hydrolase
MDQALESWLEVWMRIHGKALFIVLFLIATASTGFPQNLEIHHIDVGQGDATLIIGPNGKTILVDAGDNGYASPDGGKIVFEYLESINYSNPIDYIIVTHSHSDHVGGFAFGASSTSRHSVLLAEREAGVIKSWAGLSEIDDDGNSFIDFNGNDGCSDPAETPDSMEIGYDGTDPYFPTLAYDNGEDAFTSYCDLTKTYRRYVQTVQAAGIRIPLGSYSALMGAYNAPIDLGDGATATIVCSSGWVAQNPSQVAGCAGASSDAVDSRSVGLYVQYKGFDYLVSGDLTGNESPYMEQALRDLLVALSNSPPGDPVDVLRINHHGSNSSSAQTYLTDLKPEVVVISVGDGNSYGHPTQEVIDRLNNTYPEPLKHIYLTEEGVTGRNYHNIPHDFLNGAVVVSTDGDTYTVTNSSGGVDQYSVDGEAIPVLDIKANGQDSLLTVPSGNPVLITVSLNPGNLSGQNADWWVLEARRPGGLYYFDLSTGSMVKGFLPTYQGPLFNLGTTQLLNSTDLPVGAHIFLFAVDLSMDGSFDPNSLYFDWVRVSVTGQ